MAVCVDGKLRSRAYGFGGGTDTANEWTGTWAMSMAWRMLRERVEARSFSVRLRAAQAARDSDLALMLSPRLAQMPLPMQRYDDPFLPFGKAIIDATRDLVCAYVFDLAAYLALGAAGAVALERTIAYAGTDDATVTILHAPFVGAAYVDAADRLRMSTQSRWQIETTRRLIGRRASALFVSDGQRRH